MNWTTYVGAEAPQSNRNTFEHFCLFALIAICGVRREVLQKLQMTGAGSEPNILARVRGFSLGLRGLLTIVAAESSVGPIYFHSGVQLRSIGTLGKSAAKIHLETRQLPRYLVANSI